MATKWLGSRKCDVCRETIRKTLYDAKTEAGPWGTLCETHFKTWGIGLGTGLGQKYTEQPNGDFTKVEG